MMALVILEKGLSRVLGIVCFSTSLLASSISSAGPADIALKPSPQAFTSTCQSYSMALAMSFHPDSPFKAVSPRELRELEIRLRKEIEANAVANGRKPNDPSQEDWRAAMLKVSNQKLKLLAKQFNNLDQAMRYVADQTSISAPATLGNVFAVQLVKTPVLMSFHQIENSDYRGKNPQNPLKPGNGSHVVTVFGVELPNATMNEEARPKLLLVNSAVKYNGSEKNACEVTDLPGDRRYSAVVTLTDKYERKKHDGLYILHTVSKN